MKWFKPKDGDVRILPVFALIPIAIGDEVRWFEMCYIKQRFHSDFLEDYWTNITFADRSDYERYKKGRNK